MPVFGEESAVYRSTMSVSLLHVREKAEPEDDRFSFSVMYVFVRCSGCQSALVLFVDFQESKSKERKHSDCNDDQQDAFVPDPQTEKQRCETAVNDQQDQCR